ncbi:DUF542 domain-containing protein [Roseimaritima multifibrata]|uniref:DUF542 domain-containing protein n=1 Tax=Roseimaritima multifibrata TaxID=1930274 RepID=UPI001FE4847D|nr:DUF542 domain-containing protein [Roseimaritima multifibrata]
MDSIPFWITEYPQTAVVFHRLGIDVACEGITLQTACEKANLNPQQVLAELKAVLK